MRTNHGSIRVLLAFALATLLAVAPAANATATNQGTLTSSRNVQTYASSIYSGLENYMVAFSPTVTQSGNVYTMALNEDSEMSIVKHGPDHSFLKAFQIPSEYRFSFPLMTTDRNNNLYIYVRKDNGHYGSTSTILKYNPNDELVSTLDNFNVTPTEQLDDIYSFAIDSHENIYLTGSLRDDSTIKLYKANQAGDILSTINALQGNTGGYTQPLNVALNANDELYVSATSDTDQIHTKIFKIDQIGNVTQTYGNNLPIPIGYGINVDHNNNLYYTITDFERTISEPVEGCPVYFEIRKYDPAGRFVGIIDMSAAVSEGPVCAVYNIGASPSFASSFGVNQDGDLYVGSTSMNGGVVDPSRIVIYKTAKNIATFPGISGQTNAPQAKLELPDAANLTQASVKMPEEITMPPNASFSYPLGLVSFTAQVKNTNPLPIELYFITHLTPSQVTPMKYRNGTHSPIEGAAVTETTVDGKHALKVAYEVTDGGELDEDGVVNGEIVDPVGLAVSSTSTPIPLAPNTGGGSSVFNLLTSTSLFIAMSAVAAFGIRTIYTRMHRHRHPVKIRRTL